MKYSKQILVGAIVVVVIVAYAVYSRMSGNSPAPTVSTVPVSSAQPAQPTAQSTTPAPSTTPTTPAAPAVSAGLYKDGTYTGTAADAVFGTMQVAAVISGGKLTDVQFIQYPNSGGHTIQLNANSNPILRSEAIAAQSATVDIVSGATQSSEGFQQSLASALAQAKS